MTDEPRSLPRLSVSPVDLKPGDTLHCNGHDYEITGTCRDGWGYLVYCADGSSLWVDYADEQEITRAAA